MAGSNRSPPMISSGLPGPGGPNAAAISLVFLMCASRCVTTWLTSTASGPSGPCGGDQPRYVHLGAR